MEPKELLDCEMCRHREGVLVSLRQVKMVLSILSWDVSVAYGIDSETAAATMGARDHVTAIYNQICDDMSQCEGETIAHPLGDDGHINV